jgi:phosphate/sulfate permease
VTWETADEVTTVERNNKLSRAVHTAYTKCLDEVIQSTSDDPVLNSLSYIVYALQVIRVAIKTQSSINIEKVFHRLPQSTNHALVGAILGAFMGVNNLKHQSICMGNERLDRIMSNIQVKDTIGAFISALAGSTKKSDDTVV